MELEPIIAAYFRERLGEEHFGDFVIRKKIVEISNRPLKVLQ
jgi:sulfite reductase (NADPH) hemoprotein beta-component